MEKEDFLIILGISLAILLLIAIFVIPKHFDNEGKIIEYRIETYNNDVIGPYPVIHVVIEDESDDIIRLPKKTIEEAIQIKDSLNQTLK